MNIKHLLLTISLFTSTAFAETLDSKVVGVSTTENAKKIEVKCLSMLKNKQYKQLEDYSKSLDTSEESAKDDSGHIQIYACMNGITEYKEDITLWMKKYPKSIYPYLAKNYDSVRVFFAIRGEKVLSQTNENNYVRALQVLTDSAKEMDIAKKYGATGLWYDARLRIAFYLSEETLFDLFKEGSNKFPQYYPIYLAVAGNMKPQWGFPYESLAKVASYSAEHTKKTENYTRIYQQALTPCCNQNMIDSKTIDFKILRAGVGEILEKYPTVFNYNKMAETACLLNDNILYEKVYQNMKTKNIQLIPDLWLSGKAYKCQELLNTTK